MSKSVGSDFCECSTRSFHDTRKGKDYLLCNRCGKPIECDFSHFSDDLEDPDKEGPSCAAQTVHIDYYVCWKHLHIAVDNVWSRTLP